MPIATNCVVNYKLTDIDALHINSNRTSSVSIAERLKQMIWPFGAQPHLGNLVKEGQVFPMVITNIRGEDTVNGQVFLDGTDQLWVVSVCRGNSPGDWNYFMNNEE